MAAVLPGRPPVTALGAGLYCTRKRGRAARLGAVFRSSVARLQQTKGPDRRRGIVV